MASPKTKKRTVSRGPAQVQRENIAQWLDEREAARGGEALEPDAVKFAEQAWRNRAQILSPRDS
jgi:hypothetical protein